MVQRDRKVRFIGLHSHWNVISAWLRVLTKISVILARLIPHRPLLHNARNALTTAPVPLISECG
jgi:hypothetical protein